MSSSFVVNPVPEERVSRAANEALLTLASLEGRLPGRLDGRPRRTKVIPTNLRKRFMEVLDDNGKSKILVYITDDGKVRRDVAAVQDELEAAGEFRGMHDKWEVDLDEMMDDTVEVKRKRDETQRKRKRTPGDEDSEDDQFDEEDEDEPEERPTRADRKAVVDDEAESDGSFELVEEETDSEEYEDDEEEEEDDDDEEDEEDDE